MEASKTSSNTNNVAMKRGISGSTLKLIAIVTMLIDHIAAVVLEKMMEAGGLYSSDQQTVQNFFSDNQMLYVIYGIMRTIGRLAFPIFCFLLVEGFLHTRNARKYALRLAAFALISEIPFDLALFGKPFFFNYQNVFFTLLIGLLVMIGFKYFSAKAENSKRVSLVAVVGAVEAGCIISYISIGTVAGHLRSDDSLSGNSLTSVIVMGVVIAVVFSITAMLLYLVIGRRNSFQKANVIYANLAVLIAGITAAEFLKTDYSGMGVITIAVMYWLRSNYFKSMLGGLAALTILSPYELPAIVDLLFVKFYNGRRGINLKYLFYAFYPVHLFILYLICYFMKLV